MELPSHYYNAPQDTCIVTKDDSHDPFTTPKSNYNPKLHSKHQGLSPGISLSQLSGSTARNSSKASGSPSDGRLKYGNFVDIEFKSPTSPTFNSSMPGGWPQIEDPMSSPNKFTTPTTPTDKVIPDPLRQPPIRIPQLDRQQNQLLSPRSSFNKNMKKDLIDSLMKPKVVFSPFNDQNRVHSHVTNLSVNYQLKVKPPTFFNTQDDEYETPRNQLVKEIKLCIQTVLEQEGQHTNLDNMGDLMIFEIVDITTDGSNWDKVICFLFEECIILVDLNCESLIGKIHFQNHITSTTNFMSGIRLHLANDAVSELQICSDIPLVVSRLQYYFKKLLKKQLLKKTSLYQLTINGWYLIKENTAKLPEDLVEYEPLVRNNMEVPESFLVKLMPSPEILPLNLIVSITLLNTTSMSDLEYRASLIDFLHKIRGNLRPFDRISLIFVGIDGSGNPGKKGSFTASVEPEWSGWDSIYNEIKVQPNCNRHGRPILQNGFDELHLTLEKCRDLYPFLNTKRESVNKLIVVSTSNYSPEMYNVPKEKLESISSKFNLLLNNDRNLSVEFHRVGEDVPSEILFGKQSCQKPSLLSADYLKVRFDCRIERYGTMNEFKLNLLDRMVNQFHKICLPSVSIDISKIIGSRDLVNFNRIRMNGKSIDISRVSNLKLVFNDLLPGVEQEASLELGLDLTQFKPSYLDVDEGKVEVPVVSYASSWLNETDDYKVLHTDIAQESTDAGHGAIGSGSLTPPLSATELQSSPPCHKIQKF